MLPSGDPSCIIDDLDPDVLYESAAAAIIDEDSDNEDALVEEIFESASEDCLEELFITESLGDGDIDETQAACIADQLNGGDLAPVFDAVYAGEEPSQDDVAPLVAAYEVCGVA